MHAAFDGATVGKLCFSPNVRSVIIKIMILAYALACHDPSNLVCNSLIDSMGTPSCLVDVGRFRPLTVYTVQLQANQRTVAMIARPAVYLQPAIATVVHDALHFFVHFSS
jgi:hypothetical protein